jgi:hypothetical protein
MKMVSQSVEIFHCMEVPAKEVQLKGTDGGVIEVKPPSVHIGYKPIPLLLISYKWRGSQVSSFLRSAKYMCIMGIFFRAAV